MTVASEEYSWYSAQSLNAFAAHQGLPIIPPVSSCMFKLFCIVFVSTKFRKLCSNDIKVLTQSFKSSQEERRSQELVFHHFPPTTATKESVVTNAENVSFVYNFSKGDV